MPYVLNFRIAYPNPFGGVAYHNGACCSSKTFAKRAKILVSDREGRTSPYPAEITSIALAGRPASDYGYNFIGEYN